MTHTFKHNQAEDTDFVKEELVQKTLQCDRKNHKLRNYKYFGATKFRNVACRPVLKTKVQPIVGGQTNFTQTNGHKRNG
jgi:hypothetical protein